MPEVLFLATLSMTFLVPSSRITFQTSLRLAPRPQSPLAAVRMPRSLFPVLIVVIADSNRVVEISGS